MASGALTKKWATGVVPVIALFVLLLVSLYLFSRATQNSEQFGRLYLLLLVIVVAELLLLATLIGINLKRLIRQYRNEATGSRLTARLVVVFIILAVIPSSILYYFSVDFIRRGVDSWFDVEVEQVLDDSLNLSRMALDWRMRDMQRQTEIMAADMAPNGSEILATHFVDLLRRSGAADISLMDETGAVLIHKAIDSISHQAQRLDKVILSQLHREGVYVAIDPSISPEQGLFARIVVSLPRLDERDKPGYVLQALYLVPSNINVLADRVQNAHAQYARLEFLRGPLKFSFTLTLSLVLLLSLFMAIWAAFYSARRLVAPIRILAIGMRAVIAGDYQRRLPVGSFAKDELGFLVQSFDTMMGRIAHAQSQARRSQHAVENQKAYLETILGHLSSGVMAFSQSGDLRTANTRAEQILGIKLATNLGDQPDQLGTDHPHLNDFVELLNAHLSRAEEVWQEEVVLFGPGGRQVLMCRGAALPEGDALEGGDVVVFDDITALIQAQRDAAWGEVARRLAHEIKNPLTPIQLSAERLRHKYLATMSAEEGDLLNRATHTIVQQVEAMKKMVQAFSDYARSPKLEIVSFDLNQLVADVLELYRGETTALVIETHLDDRLSYLDADTGRIRQLLHNLIKNAVEAVSDDESPRIAVETHLHITEELKAVELSVRDHGLGISGDIIDTLFEPYVSSKPRGSGLGLAVVKKIVEEHNGVIWVENMADGGARFVLRLPLALQKGVDATDERVIDRASPQQNLFE